MNPTEAPNVDTAVLRTAIQEEYDLVALEPARGFHFHTGRTLATLLEYPNEWVDRVPEASVESFAGTGNPFSLGQLQPGERVVDMGSGAGIDSLIAGGMVGETGAVIGVDMTPSMLAKARASATVAEANNVVFREGLGEELPVSDDWADVVISNGVLNLIPDKPKALSEWFRVLKPGGRLQIADIVIERAVPENAKERIDLWTG